MGAGADRKQRGTSRRPSRIWTVLPLVGMFIGLAMLLYPLVSDWIIAYRDHQAVSEMQSTYSEADDPEAQAELHQADLYNEKLAGQEVDEEVLPYDQQLSLTKPYMAYLVCPKIDLEMPIYHGTDQEALAAGIGHIETTSLPVGGSTSNCVISAHSGMPDMRAFDDIRQLEPGDLFALDALGRECVYEVDSIEVISQDDYEAWQQAIALVPGEDACLLVTCTPYGVNDHRLLVRGHRTDRTLDRDEGAGNVNNYVNRRTIPAMAGIAVLVAALVIGAHLANRVWVADGIWHKSKACALRHSPGIKPVRMSRRKAKKQGARPCDECLGGRHHAGS